MIKYRVWGLDVWGHGPDHANNDCDGNCDYYWVNDRYDLGHLEVNETGKINSGSTGESISISPTNLQIYQALIDQKFLCSEIDLSDLIIDGDDEFLNVSDLEDCPFFQLEKV